jgi:hypothetical protein
LPDAATQTRAVVSSDAVMMRDPSRLNAAEFTASSWPLRTRISLPVAASQMRAVSSPDAVTMRDPSRLNAAEDEVDRLISRGKRPEVDPVVGEERLGLRKGREIVDLVGPVDLGLALRVDEGLHGRTVGCEFCPEAVHELGAGPNRN